MPDENMRDLIIRIDERTANIQEDMQSLTRSLATTKRRVWKLEIWRSWIAGALAALAVVLGIILRVKPW